MAVSIPPVQIVQTDSEFESTVLKLDEKASKMETPIDQLPLKVLASREKVLLGSNLTTLSVPSGKLSGESPPASAILSISCGQLLVCRVKVQQVNRLYKVSKEIPRFENMNLSSFETL